MGLDTTHGAWSGSYSSFNHWRVRVAALAGINLEVMDGFAPRGIRWDALPPDPIHVLLDHSDCEGEIPAEACAALADRLEEVAAMVDPTARTGDMIFHGQTLRFAGGLRRAAKAGQPVVFG